jgi:RNA polymerase sigma factor (sigma-70 family)
MASVVSTHPATNSVGFSPDFIANIPKYQQAIRRHRMMHWARERRLEDDLEQLALLDLARVDVRFDPNRASSPHHYRMAVLASRVSDCADVLVRMHSDITGYDEGLLQDDDLDDDDGVDARDGRLFADDPVLDAAIRGEMAAAMYEAVANLPSRQRQIAQLVLADFTDKEIAIELGISVQAVNKGRLAGVANLERVIRAQFAVN